MANREDVLAAFAMEEAITPAILKDYLVRHPELADDLLALFNELALCDLELAGHSAPGNAGLSILGSEESVEAVETALYGAGVRELASQLSLPRSFLLGLHAGFVRIGSMPAQFIKGLAGAIGVRTQHVVAAMQRGGGQAYAFKADSKPIAPGPTTFSDYVDHSGLSDHEKSALRRLMGNDGPD